MQSRTASRGRVAALAVLAAACYPALKLEPNDAPRVLDQQLLTAPDPSRPGNLPVRFLYYGSGKDRNRPEYRDSVTIETPTVDASKLVDLGQSAKSRNDYWGFTPSEMPLNARVWYPDGDGPFPLVLVVHGNHDMRDFSDPGVRQSFIETAERVRKNYQGFGGVGFRRISQGTPEEIVHQATSFLFE